MSNRIDLTQFTEISNDSHSFLWDTWILNEQQAAEGKALAVFTMDMQNPVCLIEGYETAEEAMANAKAIAYVPKMIAELKRCYKELDDLKWNHMQVLRERKDVRDELYRMAMKSGSINRQIQETIDACDGVDSLYGEEVVAMLKEILA